MQECATIHMDACEKGYIPETSVPFWTLFDIYFYIDPIRQHFQLSNISKELSFHLSNL